MAVIKQEAVVKVGEQGFVLTYEISDIPEGTMIRVTSIIGVQGKYELDDRDFRINQSNASYMEHLLIRQMRCSNA